MTLLSRKREIDLLIVNPGSRLDVFQSLGSSLSAVEPPVWAGLMATFVRLRGFSVSLLDANAEELTPREAAERIIEANPLLVVVVVYGHQPSASTQNMPYVRMVCSALKELQSDMNVLLVGGHVAALPERTLREIDAADFVCDGEGPYTIVDCLSLLKTNDTDYSKVRGLWYREGNIINVTKPAPLVNNLDQEMPSSAWDMLPMDKYRAHNWHCFGDLDRQPYAAIYTTLGCPYHCSFCCIQAPFKSGEGAMGLKSRVNSYRLWKPESVIKQIDLLVNNFGVRNIKIADEIFVLNPRHVASICNLITKRGYDLNIWCYARVDTIKEDMLEMLKKAGINWLALGIESASERVRDDAMKGITQDRICHVVEKVRGYGINVIGNYIFGLPEDDLDTMQKTLEMAIDLNCEFANFYCAMAYPGSELFRLAIENQWPLPEAWSAYSQHSVDTMPLPTRYLTAAEVLRFRDEAFQKYFHHPNYLSMITQKFGFDTARHIEEMASFKLTRKLLD